MDCQIVPDGGDVLAELEKPLLRRREVLQITGLERGRIQGWEQQDFYKWPGEPSTEKRLYSVATTARYAIVAEMDACGIPIKRAWEFVHRTPQLVVPGAVPYLLCIEIRRHGGGDQIIWKDAKSLNEVRDWLNTTHAALNAGNVRGIRTSVVNIQRVLIPTLLTVGYLGKKLESLSVAELEAEMRANDVEDAGS